MCVCLWACLLPVRHVKDSRRCGEIQRWACFITSHIETNLCPFTWRTASYSLTKLASCCGVRGTSTGTQSHTLTHTHKITGKSSHAIMCISPVPSCKNSNLNEWIIRCPVSIALKHTCMTTLSVAGSRCGVIAVIVAGCAPVYKACTPPPCGTMWHRS